MKAVIITGNLENEIKDIRVLEAKINELKELKEEKDPNFTFFPEYFIREDIERNFPPLY